VQQVGADRQTDCHDDEANEVRRERGHGGEGLGQWDQDLGTSCEMSASAIDIDRQLLRGTCLNDLQLPTREKHSGSMLPAKDFRLTTGRHPDVDMRAANLRARVVDQESSEVLLPAV